MSRPPLWLVAAVTAALLVALGGGAWLYRAQERHLRYEVEGSLQAIAQLKVAEIAEWRAERLADASQVADSLLWSDDAVRRLTTTETSDKDTRLLDRFRVLVQQGTCTDVLLLDRGGLVRLSLGGRTTPVGEAVTRALSVALRERHAVLTDLYRDVDGVSRIGTLAPVGPGGAEPAGAVLLLRDVRQFLYPLIQTWPVPSRTAETLIVRRDDDSVLYLNDLRHRTDTAFALRFPLSRTNMPAVMAVLGRKGLVEGRDYRDVPVLAALASVPGSPWFLVAKVDSAEAFELWRETARLIFGLTASCLVAVSAGFVVLWQRKAKTHYRALYRAETAGAEAAAHYATTLMSIGDAVITTDASGNVTLLNRVAGELTGVRPEEAVGRPLASVFRIVNEDSRQTVEDPVAAVLRQGTIVGLANHTVLISRSGVEHPIADSGAPIRNEAGTIIGVVLVFRDQTEERRAQKALMDSERQYRGLFEHMLEGFAYCRMRFENAEATDFRYLSVNHAFEALTGLTNVTGRWVSEVIPGIRDTDPELFEIYGRVALSGTPEKFERFVRALNMWFSISVYSPEREFFVAVFDVISERKRTEKALRESEDRYRRLVELMPDAVAVYRDWRFTYLNPAALKLFGASHPQELIGQTVIDRVHPDQRSAVSDRVRRVQQQQGPLPIIEERLLRLDGAEICAEVTSMPFTTGEDHEVLVIARDLTVERRAEAEQQKLQQQLLQAQKMEAVGRLAGGVAHDFNNMLTVIQSYTESILGQMESMNPFRAELLEVQAAAARSADLTRQLLAFSRKQTIAPRVMDLNEQLVGMNRLLDRILGEDVSLTFTLAAGLWPVYLDVTQVDQVVANLVVNSRDAMPNGGTLTVTTENVTLSQEYCDAHPEATPGDYAQMSISDSGCGMTRETMAHLFEPFFTTKSEGHGTGLGLAMVFGIVKQNQGVITAYSEPGQGTTMRVYFPRHRGGTVALSAPAAARPHGGRETILLVEDEAQLRLLGKRLLERLGYTVLDASSAAEALGICEGHAGDIHLLLTDVVMPNMNGRELGERVRLLRRGVKVVLMSGYPADTIAHRGVLEPGIDFLQKPFAMDSLGRKVREALDRH